MKAAAISTLVRWGSCGQPPHRLDDEATVSAAVHGRPTEIVVEVGTLVVRLGVGVGVGRVVAVANGETEGRGVEVVRRGAVEVVRVGSGVGVGVARRVAVGVAVGDADAAGESEDDKDGLVVRMTAGEEEGAAIGELAGLWGAVAVDTTGVDVTAGAVRTGDPVGPREPEGEIGAALEDALGAPSALDSRGPAAELEIGSPLGRDEGGGS